MPKTIFSSESIHVEAYLEARFSMMQEPMVYVVGNNLRLPMESVHYLRMAVKDSDTMYYSISIEDEHTIETIEYDGLKFELHTEISPEELLKDENLIDVLQIGLIKKLNNFNQLKMIEHLFYTNGFKIINNTFIYTKDYPYKVFRNQGYLVIKYPLLLKETEVKKDIQKMSELVLEATEKEIA